jgi:hypothetical protein
MVNHNGVISNNAEREEEHDAKRAATGDERRYWVMRTVEPIGTRG